MCLSAVLWDTRAILVHDAEIVWGRRIALVCSFAEPSHRLGVVSRQAMAFMMHGGRSVPGDSQAPLGGLAMLFHGFACVLRHAQPFSYIMPRSV